VKRYRINLYKSFKKVNFYTIHEEGKKFSETDEFFLRFKGDQNHVDDIKIIKYWIEKIGNEQGAQERYFRPEKNARAIPIIKSKLRLYCFRVNEQIVILGNGGKKSSQKVKDSPDALPHFTLVNDLAYIFNMKKQKGEIVVKNNEIKGDFSFYIKEPKQL